MSTVDPVTIEQLFAASDNAVAVTRIREWCARAEATARSEPLCHSGCSCKFDARMTLIDEVRGLLPEATT